VQALIFDCDGVLVDTERDGHRVAFNLAFASRHVDAEWGVPQYGKLLSVSGGKERMRYYFQQNGWPVGVKDRDTFIKQLHADKTELFMQIIESGQLPLRRGVARLVDEAIEAGIKLAICSTSHERAVRQIVGRLLGHDRLAQFDEILAGDVVSNKKPAPEIYNLVQQRIGVAGEDCLVVEDSRNGLLAAKGAGMHCLITTSTYTRDEDFSEADRVVSELGDPPDDVVSLPDLFRLTAGTPH
jgi:HAD superfamily hydrolase (TIGR01509 family)